jgi:catechol 2,3-dioxygenase-like lactoylglutathione lyase family enzyme
MNLKARALPILGGALLAMGPGVATAAEATFHHIHITTPSPREGVNWYERYLDCTRIADRNDAAQCGSVELHFVVQPSLGRSQDTGVDHIAFSFADLAGKIATLEKIGVRGSGVRFQRNEDGTTYREIPGLFKAGYLFDPWGTRIELVEDAETTGFHHIHLNSADPEATLKWYQSVLGGKPASLKGKMNGLRFGQPWLLVSRAQGKPSAMRQRAIDHIAFVATAYKEATADLQRQRVPFLEEPAVPQGGRTSAMRALLAGPDDVRIELVETGFAGVKTEMAPAAATADARAPYTTPKTPWGEPDLQGIYTGNAAAGIPLERPKDLADVKTLTTEEAAARRERTTLQSIWGYDREWRDITLGYTKTAPSTQVAMVIDPPDGRLPALTAEGRKRAEEARRRSAGEELADGAGTPIPGGPEELSSWVRCITRGVPAGRIPTVYNTGMQIAQGPGYVVVQQEMIHEARIIPTTPSPHVSSKLTSWLGDPRGRWEGDTLVVESLNFNGRAGFQGSSADMKLTERYTRIGPNQLEYRFTVDDQTVWTKPWTAMFVLDKDDDQYELVEYACHEANYGMTNILAGARETEKTAKGPRPSAKAPVKK